MEVFEADGHRWDKGSLISYWTGSGGSDMTRCCDCLSLRVVFYSPHGDITKTEVVSDPHGCTAAEVQAEPAGEDIETDGTEPPDRFDRMSRKALDQELRASRYVQTIEGQVAWIRSVTLPDDDVRQLLRELEAYEDR